MLKHARRRSVGRGSDRSEARLRWLRYLFASQGVDISSNSPNFAVSSPRERRDAALAEKPIGAVIVNPNSVLALFDARVIDHA
jgi:hypothetical protein